MKKNDFILIAVILILAASLFVVASKVKNQGEPSWVVVTIEGKEYARYDLDQDATYEIEPYEGENNIIKIEDSKASMIKASCSDQICVHQSEISKNGDMIVCLPHALIVSIESSEDSVSDSVAK